MCSGALRKSLRWWAQAVVHVQGARACARGGCLCEEWARVQVVRVPKGGVRNGGACNGSVCKGCVCKGWVRAQGVRAHATGGCVCMGRGVDAFRNIAPTHTHTLRAPSLAHVGSPCTRRGRSPWNALLMCRWMGCGLILGALSY